MTIAPADPLNGATEKLVKVNFYVDGWHSYLMAREVVGLHRSFLKTILKEFPEHSSIFDMEIGPEKHAQITLSLLNYAEDVIADRIAADLSMDDADVLTRTTVQTLQNPFTPTMRAALGLETESVEGKTYLRMSSYGAVFCPSYRTSYLEKTVDEFLNTLRVDSKYYELAIEEIKQVQNQIQRGDFDRTQIYYDTLGDRIGDVSQKGYLKVSRNIRRKIIEEKGVDGDMSSTFDEHAGATPPDADVFVLLTNDADHAPHAARFCDKGRRVLVAGYAAQPAWALRRAVGDHNVLNLLTKEREFDFNPIWLKTEDDRSLEILEQMRMQWQWWKSQGMIPKGS